MDLFRLVFDAGGFQESANLQELQDVRQLVPGTIFAIKKVFYVTGDPSNTGYETYDAAQEACRQLQDETYAVEPLEVIVDPQPEGLNI